MNFNYQEQLSKNKKQYITLKRLREKLNELGIQRGLNPKSDKYMSISSLDKDSLLKLLTDVQKKKALGLQNKIDRLSVENWKGGKKELISYINKHKLYSGLSKIELVSMDELKQIIINKHKGFSPIKSPTKLNTNNTPKSHTESPTNKSPVNLISKREGKIKCKQCGKMVPKVMMLKHLVSRKCKKNVKSRKKSSDKKNDDDDTPIIKRKGKRRIITSSDDESSMNISTPKTIILTSNKSTTPIKRKGKKKFLITSPDNEIKTPISSPNTGVSAISALLLSPELNTQDIYKVNKLNEENENELSDDKVGEVEEVGNDDEVGYDDEVGDKEGDDEVGDDDDEVGDDDDEVGDDDDEVGDDDDEVGDDEEGDDEEGDDEVGDKEGNDKEGNDEEGDDEEGDDEEGDDEEVDEEKVGDDEEVDDEEGDDEEVEDEEKVGDEEIYENLDDYEEGDEIKESEEIININEISSKLMNISEESIKYDSLIKNTILKSLGLL
jgi:hypothetical protein